MEQIPVFNFLGEEVGIGFGSGWSTASDASIAKWTQGGTRSILPPCKPDFIKLGIGKGGIAAQQEGVSHWNFVGPHGTGYGSGRILLHSGQLLLQETDLYIKGRDAFTDLVIARRHMTGVDQSSSIFGSAWSCNLDHSFVCDLAGNMIFKGFGREDVFIQAPGSVTAWEGTQGRLDRAVYDLAGATVTVRRPDGAKLIFAVTETNPLSGRLDSLQSSNGNAITLNYNANDTIDFITESFGRKIQFSYFHPNYPLQVSHISDFSGRVVSYTYDPGSNGNLKAVDSPVIDTGGINDFPFGKTREYAYVSGEEGRLKNALAAEIMPNQVYAASGHTRLAWSYYGEGESGPLGWVKAETEGNVTAPGELAAGGSSTFTYTSMDLPLEPGPNDPAVQVGVLDRRGVASTLEFNILGQLLKEKVITQGMRSEVPVGHEYIQAYTYNSDGLMTSATLPLGGRFDYQYQVGGMRLNAGNLIQIKRSPDVVRGGAPSEIIVDAVYEPVFNHLFKVADPRGVESPPAFDDYTLTFQYDYMEDLAGAKAGLATELGVDPVTLQFYLDAAGVVDLGEDANADGTQSQTIGNLIKIVYSSITLPLPESGVQSAFELFAYNEFGQPIKHQDQELNVHGVDYYPANDPDGDGANEISGRSTSPGGYLKTVHVDSILQPGRNNNVNPPIADLLTTYEYQEQPGMGGGHSYPLNERGVPTAIIDGNGVKSLCLVNELDQIVVQELAAVAPPGMDSLAYLKKYIRDHNDNIIEVHIQNKANLAGDDDFVLTKFSHDILDNRRSETLDYDALENYLNIKTVLSYDAGENRIQEVSASAKPEEATEQWTFDERGLLIKHIRGAGSLEQAEFPIKVDDNGNVWERLDGTLDATLLEYDGYDRLVKVTDRDANFREIVFDAASNKISEKVLGHIDFILPKSEFRQAQTEWKYDALGRQCQTDEHIFFLEDVGGVPKYAVGMIDDGDLFAGQDGKVSRVYVYDRLGRIVSEYDPDGDVTRTEWDGAGRKLKVTDPQFNKTFSAYDGNGNLKTLLQRDYSPLAVVEEFLTTYDYDSVNQLVKVVETNGQMTKYEYDSQGNLNLCIDALNNEIECRYDRLNRLLSQDTYLSVLGTSLQAVGASSSNNDPSQSGGVIHLSQTWDARNHIKTKTDDRGNETEWFWNDLGQSTMVEYADDKSETWDYNQDGEVTLHINKNKSEFTWYHDKEGRPIAVAIDNSNSEFAVVGTTLQTWAYDALGRLWGESDNNGPLALDDVILFYWLDSLGRRVNEIQKAGNSTPVSVTSEYQGDVRLVLQTYPSGNKFRREYNGNDQLRKIIRDADSSNIATFDYIGGRIIRTIYGNGNFLDKRDGGTTTIDAGYDQNGRPIGHEWKKSNDDQLVSYRYTYNGLGQKGTNRIAAVEREHLQDSSVNHKDVYVLDSSYRQLEFRPNYNDLADSTRVLDGVDKMLTFSDEGIAMNPVVSTAPGLNQYSSFAGLARSYDDDGCLIDNGSALYYEYDAFGRLVYSKKKSDESIWSWYIYDAEGRRPASCRPEFGYEESTHHKGHVVDRRKLEDEQEDPVPPTIYSEYVYGTEVNEHIQISDYVKTGTQSSPKHYYYLNDIQGSVGAITDGITGNAMEFYEYKWQGIPMILDSDKINEITNLGSKVGNTYAFKGWWADLETQLYYPINRHYDPKVGEYLTIDPASVGRNEYSAMSR